MNDEIAFGMRGTDVDDIDRHAIEVIASIRVEHRRRRREDDIAEVEGRELVDEIAQVLGRVGHRANRLGLGRREMREAFGTSSVRDDLGAGEQLIAPTMVAVVMGVDEALRR